MRYATGRNSARVSALVTMIHFFRLAKSESATCRTMVKMSTASFSYVGIRNEPDECSAAPSEQHDLNGVEQDQEVEEERKVLDVVEIVLQLLERVVDGGAVVILVLGPAGDAELHGEPLHVEENLLLEILDELRTLGARSDEAHVAHQHIEELGQLVETSPAEERPHLRHPRVALGGPHRPRLPFGVLTHGAKFVQDEDTAVLTGSRLAVEDAARRLELDGQGHQQ